MVLEMAMESLFAVVDVFYVSRVSAEAVATVGVTESMLTIVYTVALGLGIGAMAVVARRIGEKDDEGAAQAAAQAIALGLIVALAVGLAGYFNAGFLLRAMGTSPAMIESSIGYTKVMFAIDCLRIVSTGFVFFAYGLVFTQSFNGAGDTWTPTWINLGCFWAWQIPLAWLLAIHLGMGPRGVFIAMTVAFSTLVVVSGVIFRFGWWKTRRV